MPLLFANPAGLWALLGIPAILLIHFLQRESRRLTVSTLFLLQHLDRESVKGRRFDRLRHSVPLWLQLLGVLLLAWLLADPRWIRSRSVQRVVIVLDDSASMEAFRKEVGEALRDELPRLARFVATTEYTLFESSPHGATLYRGTSLTELLDSLSGWEPAHGAHSPELALRIGRGLAGAEGTLLWVTDHSGDPAPFGAARLAVGRPLPNVGFAGLRVDREGDRLLWRASIRNYSDEPQQRSWFLAAGSGRTAARTVDLEPRAILTLQGEFPDGADRATLALEPDTFTRDDQLFLVAPSPKMIQVARIADAQLDPILANLVASLENTAAAGSEDTPDLVLSGYNPLSPGPLPQRGIVFLHQVQVPRLFLSGPIVTASHELVRDLDWQGLIARSTPSIPLDAADEVLVWQGDRPLIFLRGEAPGCLVFNFDVVTSNALRLPAFVVLVHRFAARVRSGTIALEALNLELRQPLRVAHRRDEDAPSLTIHSPAGRTSLPLARAEWWRAPGQPGFFRIEQGDTPLLDAAANFADTREADLSKADSLSELGPLPQTLRERQSLGDPLWFLWALLFCGAVLLAWTWLGREGVPKSSGAVPHSAA